MSRGRLTKAALLALLLVGLLAAGSRAALVAVNDIVLHANGGFQPQKLPRHRFAPIDFQGFVEISAKGGGQPVALQEAVVDFDRDGRLNVAGLPTCAPERVIGLTPKQARSACAGAIVGTGKIEATVDFGGSPAQASSPMTIFNGPAQEGHPTAVVHFRTPDPATPTLAIVIPIEKQKGEFRYRATLKVPQIAGVGSITRADFQLGRRFSAGGQKRSYISAHCSDGILRTHGLFTFADSTVIDGSVEKACVPS